MIIRTLNKFPFVQFRTGLANPADWFRKFVKQGMSVDSGITVNTKTSLTFSAVYGCTKILSESMATMPIYITQRTYKGNEIMQRHPLNSFINKPYKNLTRYNWLQFGQASLSLWGNFYGRIIIQNGQFVGIKPWMPSMVKIIEKGGEIFYVHEKEGSFPARDVFHVSGLVTDADSYKGLSPISQAAQTIGIGLAADKFNAKFFGNGAHFNHVLQTDQKLSKEQYKNLKDSWGDRHTSPDKWFDTPILEAGLTLKSMGIPPEDSQLLQTRLFQIQDISRFYRVPLHMLNELSRSTNNNIEHQSLEFIKYTMTPWVTAWIQEFNDKLLTTEEIENNITFNFGLKALMTNDPKTQSEKLSKLVYGGIMTPNEAREELGLNPLEEGNQLYVPSALTTLDTILQTPPKNTNNQNRKIPKELEEDIRKLIETQKVKINGQE